MNPAISLPEPGQLVDVRRRRYIVVDVTQDPLARDALKVGGLQPQHLVTLSSVEDDALGEDLQVIWEIEPGATAIHKTPLLLAGSILFDPATAYDIAHLGHAPCERDAATWQTQFPTVSYLR